MIGRVVTALGGIVGPGGENTRVREAYEHVVEEFFGTGTAFAFWKGRIALYALLKALDLGEGDEVILPGYTCVMVPGPVLYAGAKPVYVDIDPEFYNLRPDEVERKLSPRTRAIVVQHSYGFPAPVERIREIADAHGISIIEDCCHTFGGRVGGRLLGTFGQAAFFSAQWNKPFSTGLGGLALVHDPDLAERVRQQQAGFGIPSRKAAFMLASQLLACELLVYPSVTMPLTQVFRWLAKKGLAVGSSSKAEFDIVMPPDYALRPAPVQCRMGKQEVGRVESNINKRNHAVTHYLAELPALGYAVPSVPDYWQAMILRFPLRVANKSEALEKASGYGVEIGSWFECPLHPIETDLEAFGYRKGDCPVAEKAAAEVINLPTHRRMSDKDIDKTLGFVEAICRPTIASAGAGRQPRL